MSVVLQKRSLALGLVAAVGSVAAVTAVNFGLRELVPVVSTGVVYLLAVLLISTYWGLRLGLLTSVLSAAAFNFFHIPPTGEFTIAKGENWVALAVLFVAAVVTSTLADAARARAEEADQRRRESDLTAEMARVLLGGASIEESLPTVSQRVAQAFDLPSVAIDLAWADSDERRRAIPLLVGGARAGTVLVPKQTSEEVLEALRERVVPSLETLVGAARRRDELEAQVIETKALRRSNVVKTALLRSVSHDVRSPLTAITTAADGLASQSLSAGQRAELTSVIATESARLTRLVDNLLDLSQLQAGGVEPHADWCDLDEVVRAAAASVPAPEAGFVIHLDSELPLINADPAQLERAIANVLENSGRYAGREPVSVRASTVGSQIVLRIVDRGPGIPQEELERIFEPFHGSRDRPGGGSGLGLAIARGFIEANGGRLRAESLPGQGASFVFAVPIPAAATPAAPAIERHAT